MISRALFAASAMTLALLAPAALRADAPAAIAASGQILVATLHAQGAQIYECRPDDAGRLAWQFREPVASLLLEGKTVGRHYAGPSWELADGSAVSGKVVARAPGRTADDIPLLLLEAVAPRGSGMLAGISAIQRLNTVGGVAEGPCARPGAYRSVPYAADYAFLKPGR